MGESGLYSKQKKERFKYMDLFDYMREQNQEKEAPLASRLRPRTLDEVDRKSVV